MRRVELDPWLPQRVRVAIARLLRRAMLTPRWSPGSWALLCIAVPIGATCVAVVARVALAVPIHALAFAACIGAGALPWLWLRERCARVGSEVVRALPAFLDLVALGLEAGCGLGTAMKEANVRLRPGPLRTTLAETLGRARAGQDRSEALAQMAMHMQVPALTTVVAAIRQAEASGIGLASLIRSQSQRCLRERFALAERRAMEAPVRMLLPLVVCIFPCTFIVIGFPLAVSLRLGPFG